MIAHHTLLENCTSLFSCSYMELLSFKCRENQLLSQALGSCAGTQVKLQIKDWDAGMLCPLRLPWDYRKGHLSHIVPSTPSSSWPGMQHMLQDYCKTCPASYPFSSSLALVSTACSCVRPGVSFPLAIPGHAEGSSLSGGPQYSRHREMQDVPQFHINRQVRLEAPASANSTNAL